MWPFRHKVDPNGPYFEDTVMPYKEVWERKRMPDPGAQNYAWESLGLVPFTPIGAGVKAEVQIMSTAPQVYSLKAVNVAGIPLTAGQVILQPLYDPDNGYTQNPAFIGSPLVPMNVPAYLPHSMGPNETDPMRLR